MSSHSDDGVKDLPKSTPPDSPDDAAGRREGLRKRWARKALTNPYVAHLKWGDRSLFIKACVAEIIGVTFLVYVGCGARVDNTRPCTHVPTGTAVFFSGATALNNLISNYLYNTDVPDAAPRYTATTPVSEVYYGDLLTLARSTAVFAVTTALAFGSVVVTLVYCLAHISGGQLNPAVSFGLFLTGKQGPVQTVCNIAAQFIGGLLGAGLLYGTVPGAPGPLNLGANAVTPGYSNWQAFLGEVLMTCVLMFTVLMVATDAKAIAKNVAPLGTFCTELLVVQITSVFRWLTTSPCSHWVCRLSRACRADPRRWLLDQPRSLVWRRCRCVMGIESNLGSSDTTSTVSGYFRNFWVFMVRGCCCVDRSTTVPTGRPHGRQLCRRTAAHDPDRVAV